MAKNSDFRNRDGAGRPRRAREAGGARSVAAGRGRDRSHDDGATRRDPDVDRIWGFHAVREALRSPRRKVLRLFATEAAAAKLGPDFGERKFDVVIASVLDIEARVPVDATHQGALLEARPLGPISIADLPANAMILILDQITDPHNVGAILRTAAAYGVDAVLTTERHSPALTGVLAKSASGALEHVPICTVVNLARAMEELADMGFTRIGLDSEAGQSLGAMQVARPLALALGAEGKGLRRLTRENCDALARLDLPGPIKSLNVSNACAVALTIVSMKLAAAS